MLLQLLLTRMLVKVSTPSMPQPSNLARVRHRVSSLLPPLGAWVEKLFNKISTSVWESFVDCVYQIVFTKEGITFDGLRILSST